MKDEGGKDKPQRKRIHRIKNKLNITKTIEIALCHRPWYWRELYPDYGASRRGKTLE
jgi:hypothetical protein